MGINISALLKEGLKESTSEAPKFTPEEQYLVCSLLCTAEYCLDTTLQVWAGGFGGVFLLLVFALKRNSETILRPHSMVVQLITIL